MKRIILIVLFIIGISVIGIDAQAQVMPSFGVTLGYAHNVGNLDSDAYTDVRYTTGYHKDSKVNGGCLGTQFGAFGQIAFRDGLFFRTGYEHTITVRKVKATDGNDGTKYTYNATAMAVPLLLGITFSARGFSEFYIAGGPMWLWGKYVRETNPVAGASSKLKANANGIGLNLLIGGNVKLAEKIYLLMELEKYSWSQYADTSENGGKGSDFMMMNHWTLRFGSRFYL